MLLLSDLHCKCGVLGLLLRGVQDGDVWLCWSHKLDVVVGLVGLAIPVVVLVVVHGSSLVVGSLSVAAGMG